MDARVALTTTDNPYNPFSEFDLWNSYDMEKGYCSNAYLARIVHLSDDMTDDEIDDEIESAIDEIISYDFLGLYKKIYKNKK